MKRGLQHHCFINPKKSGWIIALLLLITLGISVVNLRKYNTRLGEDEKIEQEVDTKEPELEVTEYKKDYSYVKDVYTREKLSQIIVDTCARWELNNREVLDEEEEDIFGTGDTTLIDTFELNIPAYKDMSITLMTIRSIQQ